MDAPFEAKYINIFWHDKSHAKKIVECDKPIDVEKLSPDNYQLDVVCYSKIDNNRGGQFAIRLLDKNVKQIPFFLLDDGSEVQLLSVKDPVTNRIWWIEGGTWEKRANRWQSRIYRSVGKVNLKIGKIKCEIDISASTFSYEELSLYLKSFRNDFWELILDDSSYIKGAGRLIDHGQVDESALRAISKFIEHVEKILAKPKVELRETQRLEPRKKNRPVPRTFMELSTKGDGRFLTSRAHVESLDIPENRYIRHTVQKAYLLIRALAAVSENYTGRLALNVKEYQNRLESFSDMKDINEEAVRFDFEEKKRRLEDISNSLDQTFKTTKWYGQVREEIETLYFKINDIAEYYSNDIVTVFFIQVKGSLNESWDDGRPPDVFATLEIDIPELIDSGYEYEIAGVFKWEKSPTTKRKRYNCKLDYVDSIKIVGGYKYFSLKNTLQRDEHRISELEKLGWKRKLSMEEKAEQDKEITSIKKIVSLLAFQQHDMQIVANALRPKIPILKNFLKKFKEAKVRVDSLSPNSMVFVQNPDYQGAHSNFKKILEMSGADDEYLLLSLQQIDEIGLVNVSNLYERWCLLQIMKVLIQRYHYKPEPNWKKNLIKQVLNNKTDVSIDFSNQSISRRIRLWYELKLKNGKRPDFILDVEADHYNDSVKSQKRFVLDAKFYQDINDKRHGGISKIINNLYHEKDYSEKGNNAVFILHPSKEAVPARKTPQSWAENSFYGEVPMFDWDKDMRRGHNHEYGAIYLSPIGHPNYLDNLQRLVGMFLQYGIETNKLEKERNELNRAIFNPETNARRFCLVCGSEKHQKKISRTKNNNGVKIWVTCTNCNHFNVYSYCANSKCRNRLIKNGEYWSYHAMEPLNPINIKCPSCGSML